MNKKIISTSIIVLVVLCLWIIGYILINGKNINSKDNSNTVAGTYTKNQSANLTSNSSVSTLRSGVTNAITYETKTNGERCAVVDLNNYQPTKNTAQKTYEWTIEFPDDNCVVQKPATNLSEQIGEMRSDNIKGTQLRKITVSYQ